ncbi:uncharacterized protein LOC126481680 isoform X1 [Schistocerca serialis cubense]|uniref:uncharacterized protein LOC126481680 isoform X1 n=1 Tax=Schistocerca serialis cubense TaxID=2023355 RepID=UPI00214DF778|nr:uncharacterized protein LOC126481680 isoform X1 [Schistocerca serialis cubense]
MGRGYGTYENFMTKKAEAMANERTPLRGAEAGPQYVFMTNPNRLYRTRIRQFQCCICAGLLAIFVAAAVITVSYSVNHDVMDEVNNTDTTVLPVNVAKLLQLTWPLKDKGEPKWSGPPEDASEVEAAVSAGRGALSERDAVEAKAPPLAVTAPAYRAQQALHTTAKARELGRAGYVLDVASKRIAADRGVKAGSLMARGPIVAADFLPPEACADGLSDSYSCVATPFRSLDGTCNNLQHPQSWGVAYRPFRRILPPDYGDGVSSPRRASDGSELPSAREVSLSVHRPLYKDDPRFTVMFAVWGQFMDHDITATAISQSANGSALSCCHPGELSPECFPVPLAAGDPQFDQFNVTCMEFVRSAPAPTCSFGPREQMTQVSAYLDGSVVYGNQADLANSLRSFVGGQMRVSFSPDGRELLPISTDPNDGCNREVANAKGQYCFAAGDPRSNENLHLTTMHLVWVRHHNALAARLQELNPTWSDERLYQEARRIIAAQMQHITYNEMLPLILGDVITDRLSLRPQAAGYYNKYDATVDATIANSFAAAAFRFAHTLIPGLMKMLANETNSEEFVETHKMLFNPYGLYQAGYMDKTVRGALATNIAKADAYFSKELTQKLFAQGNATAPARHGLDLVSLNIQRGRDHGLPGYPAWREFCGFPKPLDFSDLAGVIDPDSVSRLSALYKTVADVDLYTGMLSEIPLDGSLLGPTATCLITDQFIRLKQGDRYWYETSQQPQAFTPEQLAELRKTSLAAILCDNSDNLTRSQPWVMRAAAGDNVRRNCSELARPDWSLWKAGPSGAFARPGIARVSLFEGASAVRAAAPRTKTKIPHVALGGTVTGGSITAAGSTVWSGALPLRLPLPLFDTLAATGPVPAGSPFFAGRGIYWDGHFTADASSAKARLQGTYTAPKYHDGPPLNFSVEWSSGTFSFDVMLAWNSTKNGTIDMSGSYWSPLRLETTKPKFVLTTAKPEEVQKYAEQLLVAGGLGPGVPRAPLLIHGIFSPDKTFFTWDGNATLILPLPPPPPLPALNVLAAVAKPKEKRVMVPVSVLSGSVTTSSGVTWWSGELPAALPAHPFDTVALAAGASLTPGVPVFSSGIQWSGSLVSDGAGGASLKGSFSFPTFTHGAPANFSISWWSGKFALQMRYLGNTTLDTYLHDGQQCSSPLFYVASPQPVLGTPVDLDDTESLASVHEMSSLLIAAEESLAPALRVPIILMGTYSPDRTTFWWSGAATFSVHVPPAPPMPPMPPVAASQLTMQLMKKTSPSSNSNKAPVAQQNMVTAATGGLARPGALGLAVTSGWVATSKATLWTGTLPAAIPLPAFDARPVVTAPTDPLGTPPVYGSGVVWHGSATVLSPLEVSFVGSFSAPSYTHGPPLNFSISWTQGQFSLRCKLLWNATIDGLVDPNLVYSSPIYFQQIKVPPVKEKKAKDKKVDGGDDKPAMTVSDDVMLQLATAVDAVGDSGLRVPVILQGNFSPDKTTFYWNGNAIVMFKKKAPMMGESSNVAPRAPASLFPVSGFGPFSWTARLGGMVTSGYVRGASDSGGGRVTMWDGSLPAAIPSRPFDSFQYPTAALTETAFTPMVFGHGVTWQGSMTSDPVAGTAMLQGTFSVPRYVHGVGPFNFSIDWWRGDFQFNVQLLWNVSIDGVVTPDRTFTSPIFFSGATVLDNGKSLLSGIQMTARDAAIELAEESAIAAGAVRAPVILQGTYSPDKTMFLWSGKVVASIPRIPTTPPMQFLFEGAAAEDGKDGKGAKGGKGGKGGKTDKKDDAGGKKDGKGGKPAGGKSGGGGGGAVGLTGITGYINANFTLDPEDLYYNDTATNTTKMRPTYLNVWSGQVPVTLPVPFFNSSLVDPQPTDPTTAAALSITWSASMAPGGAAGAIKLKGTYKLPVSVMATVDPDIDVEWSSGEFSLSGTPLWKAPPPTMVQPGVNFTSPVFYRSVAPTKSTMKGLFEGDPADPTAATKVPIILQGTFTPDNSGFVWSGNALVIFPYAAA